MRNNRIAVIGDKDSILAFKAVGADVFPTVSYDDAAEKLKKIARSYAVIFISEDIAENIKETVARYKARPYPVVIPIPGANGSTGFGMKGISDDVEKAIGTDILTDKH